MQFYNKFIHIIFVYTLLFNASLTPSLTIAQEQTQTPTISVSSATPTLTPTPINTVVPKWPDEVLGLRYDLLKSNYQINKSDSNKMALVFAAEKLLDAHCLENSINRGFENSKTRPLCNPLIEDTLSIDKDNPAATCAKFGNDSSNCYQAYSTVTTQTLTSSSPALNDKDIDSHIAANDTEDITQILDQITDVSIEYKQNSTNELRYKLTVTYNNAIDKFCQPVAYEVKSTEVVTPSLTTNKDAKPFDSVLEQLAKPTSTPSSSSATHIRLVKSSCSTILDRLKFDLSDSYLIICNEKGLFSPQCRAAYKVELEKFKNTASNKSKISTGTDNNQIGRF